LEFDICLDTCFLYLGICEASSSSKLKRVQSRGNGGGAISTSAGYSRNLMTAVLCGSAEPHCLAAGEDQRCMIYPRPSARHLVFFRPPQIRLPPPVTLNAALVAVSSAIHSRTSRPFPAETLDPIGPPSLMGGSPSEARTFAALPLSSSRRCSSVSSARILPQLILLIALSPSVFGALTP